MRLHGTYCDNMSLEACTQAPSGALLQVIETEQRQGLRAPFPKFENVVHAHEQVLGKSLVYEGAPLRLERKADFVAKKQTDREAKAAAREVSVAEAVQC